MSPLTLTLSLSTFKSISSHSSSHTHPHIVTPSPDHLSDVGRYKVAYELFGVVVDGSALLYSRHNGREVVVRQNHLWGREDEER